MEREWEKRRKKGEERRREERGEREEKEGGRERESNNDLGEIATAMTAKRAAPPITGIIIATKVS